MEGIRWVVFDVGQVLVRLRYRDRLNFLAPLPLSVRERLTQALREEFPQEGEPSLFERYMMGACTTDSFFQRLIEESEGFLDRKTLEEASLAVFEGDMPGMADLVRRLGTRFSVGLSFQYPRPSLGLLKAPLRCFALHNAAISFVRTGLRKTSYKDF